jgi:membrane protein DedA with SNARE-associated domain
VKIMLNSLQVTGSQLTAILIAGCLEGLGIPWPGLVVVVAAGVAVSGNWLAISSLAILFSLSYLGGALLQYTAGRLLGSRIIGWLPTSQRRKLEAVTARYGTGIVLWMRPLAVGNYVSIPAGMLKMSLRRFSLYTLLGILPWALVALQLGGFAGGLLLPLKGMVSAWNLPAILLLGAGALLIAGWKYFRQPSRMHKHAA